MAQLSVEIQEYDGRTVVAVAGEVDFYSVDALRRAVDLGTERAADLVLDRGGLVVDGNDLIAELGVEPGPRLGRILEGLVDLVVADPALNERPTLLLLAQGMLAEDR